MASNQVRRLKFEDTPEGRERFILITQGFLQGGSEPGSQRKNMLVVAREAEVLRKILKIARKPQMPDEPPSLDGAGDLVLSEAEYQIVKTHYDATQWSTGMSIKAEDTWNWFLSIEPESSE